MLGNRCTQTLDHLISTNTSAELESVNGAYFGAPWENHMAAEFPFIWSGTERGIRLIVGFQPLVVISPTASWILWLMQVYAWWVNVELSCFGRATYARQFWVPSHRFNFATGEQKGITQAIYTDSEPRSRMPNSLMPSAKLRSANLPFFTYLVWRGRGSNPGLPQPERTL